MTPAQSAMLFGLLGKSDIEDRHAWASGILGRDVESYKTLTVDEAGTLIDRLDGPPIEAYTQRQRGYFDLEGDEADHAADRYERTTLGRDFREP